MSFCLLSNNHPRAKKESYNCNVDCNAVAFWASRMCRAERRTRGHFLRQEKKDDRDQPGPKLTSIFWTTSSVVTIKGFDGLGPDPRHNIERNFRSISFVVLSSGEPAPPNVNINSGSGGWVEVIEVNFGLG